MAGWSAGSLVFLRVRRKRVTWRGSLRSPPKEGLKQTLGVRRFTLAASSLPIQTVKSVTKRGIWAILKRYGLMALCAPMIRKLILLMLACQVAFGAIDCATLLRLVSAWVNPSNIEFKQMYRRIRTSFFFRIFILSQIPVCITK